MERGAPWGSGGVHPEREFETVFHSPHSGVESVGATLCLIGSLQTLAQLFIFNLSQGAAVWQPWVSVNAGAAPVWAAGNGVPPQMPRAEAAAALEGCEWHWGDCNRLSSACPMLPLRPGKNSHRKNSMQEKIGKMMGFGGRSTWHHYVLHLLQSGIRQTDCLEDDGVMKWNKATIVS